MRRSWFRRLMFRWFGETAIFWWVVWGGFWLALIFWATVTFIVGHFVAKYW